VRGLLLIAASLLLVAVVAVLAISGMLPADNHLSHASSVLLPWV